MTQKRPEFPNQLSNRREDLVTWLRANRRQLGLVRVCNNRGDSSYRHYLASGAFFVGPTGRHTRRVVWFISPF